MRRQLAIAVAIVVVAFAAWKIAAGPLDPPSGPIGPTFKTLTEIEPRTPIGPQTTPGDGTSVYRITAPGSYYLTANLAGAVGMHGITVLAPGVSIDLNGFAVSGVEGSLNGILVDDQASNTVVRNGTISGWGADGIQAGLARGGSFENLRLTQNNFGLRASHASVIQACVATDNSLTGILGSASVIRGCVAFQNGASGISLNAGGVIDQCEAANNGEYGILALHRATITNSSAMANTQGGIFGQNACVIRDCSAGNNAGDGIRAHTGSIISGCTAYENAAGIHIVGNGCRIEDNNVYGNDTGIDVDAANNFIVRNTTRSNSTNFSVIAGNELAPIISNPGTTFTNATPWSNFSF